MPSARISSNMPGSTAICGNIETRRMVSSSSDAAAEADAAERVGRGHAEEQRQEHDGERDEERVQDVARRRLLAEHRRRSWPGGSRSASRSISNSAVPVLQRGDDRVVEREHGEDDDRPGRGGRSRRLPTSLAPFHRPVTPARLSAADARCRDRGDHGDDQEQQGRGGRAVADLVEVDQLLARIDRHRHGRLVVAGHHVDQVEDAQRVEAAEDHRHHQRRPDQRQGDLPEHPERVDAVDPGRLVDIGRQHLQAGQDQQRHERRGLPDVDDDHRGQRGVGRGGPGDRLVDEAEPDAGCR